MSISTQPLFIRNGNSVVNATTATTLTFSGDFTLLLDEQCNKVAFVQGDDANALFERAKKVIHANSQFALKLENGGFIDSRIISTAFISPKTNNLVIVGTNKRPLCVLTNEVYSDLDGLTEVILDGLVSVSSGEKMPSVDWASFKRQ